MLEVGCSYGAVLASFRDRGWAAEGIEVDERAARVAREERGLRVHTTPLEDIAGALDAPYRAITLSHVVEHIPDPLAACATLYGLLEPGGRLILRTPNFASFVARATSGWWEWCVVPEHVHLFTPESVRLLLRAAGFAAVAVRTRRGDAHGVAYELVRARVRRRSAAFLQRRQPQGGTGAARDSGGARFARVQLALAILGAPLEFAVAAAGAAGLHAGAEMVVVADRGPDR